MKVAVVGGGGREHALAYILAKSPIVEKLYALPGSDAMASIAEPVAIGVEDLDGIADFVRPMVLIWSSSVRKCL